MSMLSPADDDTSLSAPTDSSVAVVLPINVLNALSAHIAVIDSDGRIIATNDAWEKFALKNCSDIRGTGIGCNYLEACRKGIFHDNFKSDLEALHGIERVLHREIDEYELEYPCHTADCRRWFLMRCTRLQDSAHAVICHIDITGKILAENKLRSQDEELQAIHRIHRQVASQIELEPVITTILDQILLLLQPDLAMLFLQEGDTLILKEAVPSRPESFCHDTIQHKVGTCLCGLSIASRKAVFSYDILTDSRCTMNECKNAGYRSFASIPLINGTDILGCIGIASKEPRDFSTRKDFLDCAASDVTLSLKNALIHKQLQLSADDIRNELHERKRLEQSLVQSQKLEAIGHLAGGIAHDFNNILAAIMGYSELALKKTVDIDAREYLGGSLKACNRAKDLIQQILTFSRKSDNNLMPLDLQVVIKETIPLVRASLPSSITVIDQFNITHAANIRGNPSQLQRVFMNLCSNGAQAMLNSGGMLIVKLSEVTIDQALLERCPELKLNNQYIELSVSDTGTGIATEHLNSIFEPYFSTKVPGKGTGLGLAVVHGIVKHHHGGVIVDSFPNHGTTFSLYFPRIDTQIPSAFGATNTELPKGSGHILIVDDEAAIVQVLRRILESKGYTTTCTEFAKEAIALFRKSPAVYDLVLCDLTMPDITGDVLARQMKAIRSDISIILCTGHSPELLKEVNTSHIDRVLQKPIPQTELLAALQEVLAGKTLPRR